MAQIKWQNVNAPDFTPVANMQNTAAQQMNRGVDSIMGVFNKYAQMKENQYQEDKDENTQSAISDAMQIASSKEFQEAAQQGDFTAAALKDKYGSNINLGKLNDFISGREDSLLKTESGRLTLDNQQIAHDARGVEQQIYSLIGSGRIGEASKLFRSNAHNLVNGDKIASALALGNERASMRAYRNMQLQTNGLPEKLALASAQKEMSELFSNAAKNGEDLETLKVSANAIGDKYNISPDKVKTLYDGFNTNYSTVALTDGAKQSISAFDAEQSNLDKQYANDMQTVANNTGLVPQLANIALADISGEKKYDSDASIVGEMKNQNVSSEDVGDIISTLRDKYPNLTSNQIGRIVENSLTSGSSSPFSGSDIVLVDKSRALNVAAGVSNMMANQQKELQVYQGKLDALQGQHKQDSENVAQMRKVNEITNRQIQYNPELLEFYSYAELFQMNLGKYGNLHKAKKK